MLIYALEVYLWTGLFTAVAFTYIKPLEYELVITWVLLALTVVTWPSVLIQIVVDFVEDHEA